MIFLLLSILCSTLIILIFKLLANYRVNGLYAIIINYWTCVVTGSLTGGYAEGFVERSLSAPWLPIALVLGLLFISGFYAINLTVRYSGITVASIASKNSMVIATAAAFWLYGDAITLTKVAGIVLAVVAIILSSLQPSKPGHVSSPILWLLPLGAFAISGTIETLIKYTQHYYLPQPAEYPMFLVFLFATAATLGTLAALFQQVRTGFRGSRQQALRNLVGGIVLGIPNYGSIYFLIRTLEQPRWESSMVFPVNNIGVVIAAAVAAWLFFGERLTRRQLAGLAMAIVAILLITYHML